MVSQPFFLDSFTADITLYQGIFSHTGPCPNIACTSNRLNSIYMLAMARLLVCTVDLDLWRGNQLPSTRELHLMDSTQAQAIIKDAVDQVKRTWKILSTEEKDRFRKNGPLGVATTPSLLKEILQIADEAELVNLLKDKLYNLPDPTSRKEQLSTLAKEVHFLFISENLNRLPASIGKLTALTLIRVSYKQLQTLPDSIGNLTSLTELHLPHNQLTTIPDSIGKLTALTELDLSGNQLTTIPDSIGKLTNLTWLGLYYNRLQTLPDSIGNLTALTIHGLSYNRLQTLPDSIGNLTALTALDLSYSRLQTLPGSIGNLTAKTALDIRKNPEPPESTRCLAYNFCFGLIQPRISKDHQSIAALAKLLQHGCKVCANNISKKLYKGLMSQMSNLQLRRKNPLEQL